MAFGKYWIQLFLFCCSNNVSHDIFLLNRFLSVPTVLHSVVWICRADSSCKTQSLCFLMSDFVFPLTPVTTYLSSTFTDSTYQQGLYSMFVFVCLIYYVFQGHPCCCIQQDFLHSRLFLLSRVLLFVTPWTAAHQASLCSTISSSLLKLMSIESVMRSDHLILCRPLLPPAVFSSTRVFSNELVLHIRCAKVLELHHQSFQ